MARQPRPSNSDNQNRNNESWFKRNEHLSQFVINAILATLTLITLIVTALYSNKSLHETHSANILAESAYKLNKDQWDSLKRENKINEIANAKKLEQDSIKYTKDTTRISSRDKFQIQSFQQQLDVYKGQLTAIETQAKIAKQQFEFQSIINKQQIYKNRPVFILTSTSYDSTKNRAYFIIRNVGNTPSTIIRTTLFAINKRHLKSFVNYDIISRNELNGTTYSGIYLNIDKWDYGQDDTLYYISFLYTDLSINEPLPFVKYFAWKKEADNNTISWSDLSKEDESLIKSIANTNRLKLREKP